MDYLEFLQICAKKSSLKEFKHLLDLFLTIEEKENLAARYLIIKALLEDKMTQREISQEYQVSIAQITRGSNALKMIDPQLKKNLKNLLVR